MKRWMWVPLAALVCVLCLLPVFRPATEDVPSASIPAAVLPETAELLPVSVPLSDAVLPEDAEEAASDVPGTLYALPEGYRFRSGALWKDGVAHAFRQGQAGAPLAVQQFSASLEWQGQTLSLAFDWCRAGDGSPLLLCQPELEALRCAAESIDGNTDTVLFQLFAPDARLDVACYALCHLTKNTAEWLFPAALEPYEILSLELSPTLEGCVFSTLENIYYSDGQQTVELTDFCAGTSPTGRWMGEDLLLFSTEDGDSAHSFCQRYAPDSGTVTDVFMNLPRYVQQRQPEGLRFLRTCAVSVSGTQMQVVSLYDGTKSDFFLSGQALRSVDEPVEGLLALLYEDGSFALTDTTGVLLRQGTTGIAPTLASGWSVQGRTLWLFLENEGGCWIRQLPLNELY